VLPPSADPLIEREHRRLQHLIKRMAEQSGYKATIEQPTDDGQGRIDVALVMEDKRIACEICVTTSTEHEVANITKCLASGYDEVIVCSSDKRALEKIRALGLDQLSESDLEKVILLEPQDLVARFEEEAASAAGKTDRVKGYKVKLSFQPVADIDKKTKRQAVAKALLQSFSKPD
jgi:hypothetical protein